MKRHAGQHPRRLLMAAGTDHADEDAQADPLVELVEPDVTLGGGAGGLPRRRSGTGGFEKHAGEREAAQERGGREAGHGLCEGYAVAGHFTQFATHWALNMPCMSTVPRRSSLMPVPAPPGAGNRA